MAHKGDIEKDGLLSLEEFAGFMMENPADFYYGVLWNKLFKREIIAQHGLSMDKTISWCEDFMFNLEYLRHVKTVYALRVPVYYYVKTKGSLVSQGLSLTKTIKMKRMVFEYYHDFYKSVLTEEDYEKNRLYVYRFLLAAAGDGAVPLSIFPGAVRLGDERSSVNHDALRGDGVLLDAYRDRKLLDHYVEPVAIRYSLTLPEISLLVYLSQKPAGGHLKGAGGYHRHVPGPPGPCASEAVHEGVHPDRGAGGRGAACGGGAGAGRAGETALGRTVRWQNMPASVRRR